MRKFIFLLISVVAMFNVAADEKSKAILDQVAAKIKPLKSYRVEFTVNIAGKGDKLKGEAVVSGNNYYLNVYDSEVFFDGKTKQTYSKQNNEMVIENPEDDGSLLSNPKWLFEMNLGAAMTFQEYLGEKMINGRKAHLLKLKKNAKSTDHTLYVTIDAQTYRLMKVRLETADENNNYEVTVDKFLTNISVNQSMFRFDKKRYPEVEIVDFR